MDQAENLRKLVNRQKESEHGCTTVTIASGKGGTGKTSFCINFAIALSSLGKSVMVVDADFGLSNVDVMLGANPQYHLGQVINGEVGLKDAVCRGHGDILYIGGGSGATELLSIKKKELQRLTDELMKFDEELDFIIFDCGAGVNKQVLQLVSASDECVLVLTPEPTSIVDAFVLMKSIAGSKVKPPVSFVINRCDTTVEGMTGARHFKNIVQKYLNTDINFMGQVRFDRNVTNSIKKQVPVMLSYPTSVAAKDIKTIASDYTGADKPKPKGGGLRKLFDRVVMSFGK